MTARAAPTTIAKHLSGIPAAVRPTVQTARRLVKAVAPEAAEVACQSKPPRSASAMWKIARYRLGEEIVVTIGTFTRHASMFFSRGSELDDPTGLLEGSGAHLRYITLRAPADAERPAVKRLLRRAFDLAREARS
jgi:hypothetical protein